MVHNILNQKLCLTNIRIRKCKMKVHMDNVVLTIYFIYKKEICGKLQANLGFNFDDKIVK